jgi:acyl-CoA dehydrogenase
MDFDYSPRQQEFRARVREFMDRYVIPNHTRWRREVAEGANPPPVIDELKAIAKAEGLWNLFLPGLKPDEPGTRLSNLEYAPLAEIMGQIVWAPEVFNCNAPDTGNMELLHLFASPEQRERWLKPLLEGEIRSCFAMTEPDSSSSDASNISTRIELHGDEWVINGRKWFITGAMRARCKIAIVMGVTNPNGERHRQQRWCWFRSIRPA